jgi:hypothetical protein
MEHARVFQIARHRARPIAWGVLLALFPMLTGCYGYFPLTRIIYQLNGEMKVDSNDKHNKFVQALAFWLFVFVPVYFFAAVGDVLVFNLFEFWTDNTMVLSYHAEKDGKQIALESQPGTKNAVLTISKNGQVLEQRFFNHVSDTRYEVRNGKGDLLGSMEIQPNRRIQLQDAMGIPRDSVVVPASL